MKFYKNGINTVSYLISFILLESMFILLTIFKNIPYISLVCIIIPILGVTLLVFGYKYVFMKVVIDENGIKWLLFKKTRRELNWKSVFKVEKAHFDFTQSLRLNYIDSNNEILYFNISRRKMRRIISICPLEEVRKQLINIKLFL
jgi:hypothetical protein